MNLTTRQVADKLNIGTSAVRVLLKKGRLVDVAENSNGGKKHELYFDSKAVNEFKKVYVKRARAGTIKTHVSNVNGIVKDREEGKSGIFTRLSAVESRLITIERKLDKLVRMWE